MTQFSVAVTAACAVPPGWMCAHAVCMEWLTLDPALLVQLPASWSSYFSQVPLGCLENLPFGVRGGGKG